MDNIEASLEKGISSPLSDFVTEIGNDISFAVFHFIPTLIRRLMLYLEVGIQLVLIMSNRLIDRAAYKALTLRLLFF